MTTLTAAVVLVTALCLLNLALTLGVIRRLRIHAELLNAGPDHAPPLPILAPGEQVGHFESRTIDGEVVDRDLLDGGTLIGFFSTDCWACKEQLPRFIEHASQEAGQRPLSVVVSADGADDLVAALRPAARVVREELGGPLSQAFGVQGFPAFCRMAPGGAVLASSHDLDAVLSAPKPEEPAAASGQQRDVP